MSQPLLIAGIVIFVAAFIAAEATFNWWRSTRSDAARRLDRRLAMIGGAVSDPIPEAVRRRRLRAMSGDATLLERARGRVEILLLQAGSEGTPGKLFATMVGGGVTGAIVASLFRLPAGVFVACIVLGAAAPYLLLLARRAGRLKQVELQLPDALDMIGRALRSGHSFASALQLAGNELPDPIGRELRETSDEISLGASPGAALERLARRVPLRDLGFFVIAVVIQRETGGNLAEILDNIARIIRERLKLFGKVRAISAEARISAWVLSLLPIATAAILYLVNPGFISQLWTEPAGVKMIYAGAIAVAIGIIWMRSIIRIHV